MSRYRQTSLVPLFAALLLLGAFIAVVVVMQEKKKESEEQATFPETVYQEPEPPPVAYRPPEVTAPEPPPRPRISAEQAEKRLREATREWRAFTVELCDRQNWKSPRAVAFLQKVTWNDRDLEKQHANGVQSIRRMLGLKTSDPVALVEALDEKGSYQRFFSDNWSKVDVDWEEKQEPEIAVLEDAWKPNRIRWGFPLDTPVDRLQEFKLVGLKTATDAWRGLVVAAISQQQDLDDNTKMIQMQEAIGENARAQEAKMHAGFRELLGLPDGSVKEVVEEFLNRAQAGQEEFARSLVEKMGPALEAARKTE